MVDTAGEALGLTEDPLSTSVGLKIEEAVDADVDIENWDFNCNHLNDVCDLIINTEGGYLQATRAIRKKLQKSSGDSPKSAFSTLTILENCVKHCGREFVALVCQVEYIEDIVNIILTTNNEVLVVKTLALVQSWALEFSSDRDTRGIAEVYMQLKDRGLPFPPPSEEDLKEAEDEDIEAFMKAHEDVDPAVLEELIVEESIKEETSTTDVFEKFLEKRIVKVEIDALMEEFKKDPSEKDDLNEGVEIDMEEEALMEEFEQEMKISEVDSFSAESNKPEISTEFSNFLVQRVETVQSNDH